MSKIGATPSQTSTTQLFRLGERFIDYNGYEYMYTKASAAIGLYDVAFIKSTYKSAALTDTFAKSGGNLGAASLVAFAADEYGWLLLRGQGIIKVKASCAANVQLYTTATAGSLDDATASTSQLQVQGIILTSAEAASSANAVLTFPLVRRLEI